MPVLFEKIRNGLETGKNMHSSYELIEKKEIKEMQGEGFLLRHKKSGARIFVVLNDDENKVFSIAFRTPPADSTGVAHIMEHSVLCGSDKFPLKDPFVELAKGSLNTFLNAMTYPDKTVYPVASCNDKDFENLMDVYMDAVLHPNIYKEKKIFEQEGWHYEMNQEEDPLIYNGVVYNEMKGAFSNPEGVLDRYIMHTLYKDTSYANESGGDPDVIPELTYEQFLQFHKTYYHPCNSYIYLYGKMDMDQKLEWLDQNYLNAYEDLHLTTEIKEQNAFSSLQEEEIYYSVGENESLDRKTYLSLSTVVGKETDAKTALAWQILEYVLLDAPGAPLKQALLDAGIGEDILGGYENGILQPYFSVVAKNAQPEQKEDFLQVIHDTLKKLAENGLDQKSVLAGLNYYEFKYREADYGQFPKGLMYGLMALDTWLYDGKPWENLCYEEAFAALKKEVKEGYFERLLQEQLIDNPFSASVMVKPQAGLTQKKEEVLAEKLATIKASMSEEQRREVIENTKQLKLYQDTPTEPEVLRMLPLLTREDIRKEADPLSWNLKETEGIKILHSSFHTNQIAYLKILFDTEGFSDFEISCAGLLKVVLGYIGTKKHTYQDLSSEILLNTGGLDFSVTSYPLLDQENRITGMFSADTRLLVDKLAFGFDMIAEILTQTVFEDEKRIGEILAESRSRVRMSLEGASHRAAVNRATGYFSANAKYADLTLGIDYYHFLETISKQFETDPAGVIAMLRKTAEKLFVRERMMISIALDDKSYCGFEPLASEFIRKIPSGTKEQPALEHKFTAVLRNEGFKTASQVNYVARCGKFDRTKHPYTGALRILKVLLSYDYLWINLRVKGGAYGCMSGFGRSGEGYLVSYRDPNLAATNRVYEAIPDYLRNLNIDERDMTKYIIGTMSELDTPLTASARAARNLSAYLSGVTNEMLQRERDEILSAKLEDLRALADYVQEVLDTDAACVIGNAAAVEEDCSEYKEIRELYE